MKPHYKLMTNGKLRHKPAIGELRCKICNARNFPLDLNLCTRLHCPKIDGGFIDIANATISDLNWIKPISDSKTN